MRATIKLKLIVTFTVLTLLLLAVVVVGARERAGAEAMRGGARRDGVAERGRVVAELSRAERAASVRVRPAAAESARSQVRSTHGGMR